METPFETISKEHEKETKEKAIAFEQLKEQRRKKLEEEEYKRRNEIGDSIWEF